eukprot:Awhi_evm1s1475
MFFRLQTGKSKSLSTPYWAAQIVMEYTELCLDNPNNYHVSKTDNDTIQINQSLNTQQYQYYPQQLQHHHHSYHPQSQQQIHNGQQPTQNVHLNNLQFQLLQQEPQQLSQQTQVHSPNVLQQQAVETNGVGPDRHVGDGLHECCWMLPEKCGQRFADGEKLLFHIRNNHLAESHICWWEDCKRGWFQKSMRTNYFKKKDNALSHIRIHLNYFPHRCEICDRPFKRHSDYKKHVRQHSTTSVSGGEGENDNEEKDVEDSLPSTKPKKTKSKRMSRKNHIKREKSITQVVCENSPAQRQDYSEKCNEEDLGLQLQRVKNENENSESKDLFLPYKSLEEFRSKIPTSSSHLLNSGSNSPLALQSSFSTPDLTGSSQFNSLSMPNISQNIDFQASQSFRSGDQTNSNSDRHEARSFQDNNSNSLRNRTYYQQHSHPIPSNSSNSINYPSDSYVSAAVHVSNSNENDMSSFIGSSNVTDQMKKEQDTMSYSSITLDQCLNNLGVGAYADTPTEIYKRAASVATNEQQHRHTQPHYQYSTSSYTTPSQYYQTESQQFPTQASYQPAASTHVDNSSWSNNLRKSALYTQKSTDSITNSGTINNVNTVNRDGDDNLVPIVAEAYLLRHHSQQANPSFQNFAQAQQK